MAAASATLGDIRTGYSYGSPGKALPLESENLPGCVVFMRKRMLASAEYIKYPASPSSNGIDESTFAFFQNISHRTVPILKINGHKSSPRPSLQTVCTITKEMKTFLVLLLSSVALVRATPTPDGYGSGSGVKHFCLNTADSTKIMNSWLELWRGDFAQINNVLGSNFAYYDREQDLTRSTPSTTTLSAFEGFIKGDGETALELVGTIESKKKHKHKHKVDWCTHEAVGWKYYKNTNGKKIITEQGTDILKVDPKTKKIIEAESYKSLDDYYKYCDATNKCS